MKTIFRSMIFGVVLTAFTAAAATAGYAQDKCADTDAIAAADALIRTNYPKIATLKVAVDGAKVYLEKYGECEATKDFSTWLKEQLPIWEKKAKNEDDRVWSMARADKFENGMKTAKFEDSYAAGTELLTKYPNNMNIVLPLALVGLYESYKNNFKFNDDSIRYAKIAIDKLKNGTAESRKDKDGKPLLDSAGKELYGAFQFIRNKDEAISELTYALAHINYYARKDRKAALPYYYEVTQMPGAYKSEPRLYVTLASYYVDESVPIGKEIVVLIEKQKAAPTDEEKEKLDVEIKAKEALYNGYTERALDAYGRAYNSSDEKIVAEKTLKAGVYKTLQNLYEARFEKKDGLDPYIKASTEKPVPDPTREVTPVFDPEPLKTTTLTTVTTVPAPVKVTGTNGKSMTITKP